MDYELAHKLAEEWAAREAELMYSRPCKDKDRVQARMALNEYRRLVYPSNRK